MKSMWHSRRDLAHHIDCYLRDESVEFDIFHGVSDNHRPWFDLEHARATIGSDPADNGEEWDAPPDRMAELLRGECSGRSFRRGR